MSELFIESAKGGYHNWFVNSSESNACRVGRRNGRVWKPSEWKRLRHNVVSGTAGWGF